MTSKMSGYKKVPNDEEDGEVHKVDSLVFGKKRKGRTWLLPVLTVIFLLVTSFIAYSFFTHMKQQKENNKGFHKTPAQISKTLFGPKGSETEVIDYDEDDKDDNADYSPEDYESSEESEELSGFDVQEWMKYMDDENTEESGSRMEWNLATTEATQASEDKQPNEQDDYSSGYLSEEKDDDNLDEWLSNFYSDSEKANHRSTVKPSKFKNEENDIIVPSAKYAEKSLNLVTDAPTVTTRNTDISLSNLQSGTSDNEISKHRSLSTANTISNEVKSGQGVASINPTYSTVNTNQNDVKSEQGVASKNPTYSTVTSNPNDVKSGQGVASINPTYSTVNTNQNDVKSGQGVASINPTYSTVNTNPNDVKSGLGVASIKPSFGTVNADQNEVKSGLEVASIKPSFGTENADQNEVKSGLKVASIKPSFGTVNADQNEVKSGLEVASIKPSFGTVNANQDEVKSGQRIASIKPTYNTTNTDSEKEKSEQIDTSITEDTSREMSEMVKISDDTNSIKKSEYEGGGRSYDLDWRKYIQGGKNEDSSSNTEWTTTTDVYNYDNQ